MLEQLLNSAEENEDFTKKYNSEKRILFNQLLQAFLENDFKTINHIYDQLNLSKSTLYEEYLNDLEHLLPQHITPDATMNSDLKFSDFVIGLIQYQNQSKSITQSPRSEGDSMNNKWKNKKVV